MRKGVRIQSELQLSPFYHISTLYYLLERFWLSYLAVITWIDRWRYNRT